METGLPSYPSDEGPHGVEHGAGNDWHLNLLDASLERDAFMIDC